MTGILDSIKFAENERKINEQRQQQQQKQQTETGGEPRGQDTSALSKLVAPVKSNLPADSLKKLLAGNKFDLGNLFFTELNIPDSAYYYYKDVLDNHPDSRFEGQTLYAIGSYYLVKGDTVKADSLFNVVYDNYKTENIVNAAATRLGKPLINLKYDPAEELYADAEQVMLKEEYDSSLVKFYNIFVTYPQSSLAPKALYAGGWILENELKLPDSAAVFYDSIVVKYPLSEYASAILPKLNMYKQEKDRIKRELEDSLALIQQEKEGIDTTGQKISPNLQGADTTGVISGDSLKTGEEGNEFENPDESADSLKLLQETIIDSLQGEERRGFDSTGTFNPPADTLKRGRPPR